MSYTAMTCPSCGSKLDAPEGVDSFFCQFCGSKIVKDKKFVEVSFSGVATEESLLERAILFLEDSNFDEADLYFDRVLDIDPKCSKAYLGKVLCRLKKTKPDELVDYDKPLGENADFQKAMRFAPAEKQKQFEQLAARSAEAFKQKEADYQKRLKTADTAVEEKRLQLANLAPWHTKQVRVNQFAKQNTGTFLKLGGVLLFLALASASSGTSLRLSGTLPCLILAILVFGAAILLRIEGKKASDRMLTYEEEEIELTRLEREYERLWDEHQLWLEN